MIINNGIRKLTKNKDAKALFGNLLSLSLLQIANYLFPLITLPYLAKTIGLDKFGAIAFATSVIVYFQTFVDYGFQYTAVRDISKNRDSITQVSHIFSSVLILRVIFMFLSFGLLLLLIHLFSFFYENRIILLLTFLTIPGQILFPVWFFQAIERMQYITILNVVSRAIFTLLVFIVIKEKEHFIFQPLLLATGNFICGIASLIIIRYKFSIRFVRPSLQELLSTLREGLNMFLSLLFPNLYTNFSVILLRIYGSEADTGVFSSGYRFVLLTRQLSTVLSRTFFPFLARRIDKHKVYRNISGIISIIMSVVLFVSSNLLIKIFYTNEFSESSSVLRIMSLAPVFLFLMDTYGTNFLVLIKKEKTLLNIIILCSVFGFVLSWIMVSKFFYIGAAISIMITWIIRGLITWYYAYKHGAKSEVLR